MSRMLPPLPDWIVALNRMSGKSVVASRSITPQALSWPAPCGVRPMDSRTVLRAPSHPTTNLASTVISVSPSPRRILPRPPDADPRPEGVRGVAVAAADPHQDRLVVGLRRLECDDLVAVVDLQAA